LKLKIEASMRLLRVNQEKLFSDAEEFVIFRKGGYDRSIFFVDRLATTIGYKDLRDFQR
jgi:hypothetical protein